MQYKIPERNLEGLTRGIEKLNKRARKLGVSQIQITVGDFEEVEAPRTSQEIEFNAPRRYMRVYNVDVVGETPKISGWTFAATIQHTEEGNVLRKAPGCEVELSAYRNGQPLCEHCQTRRRRNDTFVVLHENGTTKQIGRQCTKDFLGFHGDPEKLAKHAELIFSLGELCQMGENDSFEGGFGSRGIERVSLEDYLSHVAECMIQHGFVSGKKAREHFEKTNISLSTTSGSAWKNMFPPRDDKRFVPLPITNDAKELAKKSIDFVLEQLENKPDLNDFEHNMLILAKCESIEPRNSGLAAYLVQYYRRETEKTIERAKAPVSNFFGAAKIRYRSQRLTYTATFNLPGGQFGDRMIHKFLDASGNIFVWKTNTPVYSVDGSAACIGDFITMDFTVKDHSNYKGTNQTVITRCKVMPNPAPQVEVIKDETIQNPVA